MKKQYINFIIMLNFNAAVRGHNVLEWSQASIRITIVDSS